MESDQQIAFGPFRFDWTAQRLWQGPREIHLRARTRAVLHYLLEHPGRIIARQEFAQHVWDGTHVTRGVLRVCIWELRRALGDAGTTPSYIETVGHQGYRWCAATRSMGATTTPERPFVGREAELVTLQTALEQACRGKLQLVFVAGDPGIGKTTLIRQWLLQEPTTPSLGVGRGQCVEHFGPGEAYLPVLEALTQLGSQPGRASIAATLRHIAPLWLVHLPLLVEPEELDGLQRQVQRLGRERMLRQLVEALTVITQDTPVVLVLEDLQWSDTATVEALGSLARYTTPLRLLVLGTYRPAEVIARGHPLRQTIQELVAHGLCQELRLELLTQAQVQAYVAQRLAPDPPPVALGPLLYHRTDGNALFVVQLLDHLMQQGWLADATSQGGMGDGVALLERALPDGLRALLLKQVESLDTPVQQVLDAASINGSHFTTAALAAILQWPVEEVEAICDALTRQGAFLVAHELVTWPDGTATARYGLRHALYGEVLYARLGLAQRARWHLRVAERLEMGYGHQAREMAGELALHFTRGQDVRRAAQYQHYAAEQALRRNAYTEALGHCQQGLELLATLPASPARASQELTLRLTLSIALAPTQGITSEALAHNLQQALELCEAVEETTALVPVLVSLTRLSVFSADRAAAERLMAQERALLQRLHDPASLIQIHMQLGTAETLRGAYAQAEEHHGHVLRLYEPEVHRPRVSTLGSDPAVIALALSGWRLWLTGWPDQAVDHTVRALAHAEPLAHLHSLMDALSYAARVRMWRGEFSAALGLAQRLADVGRAHDFVTWEAVGMILQGSVWAQDGEAERGLPLPTTGLAQYRRHGSRNSLPAFLSYLAQAHLQYGQVEEGLAVIDEAWQLIETNLACYWTPEMHRLHGELLLARAGAAWGTTSQATAPAEACFQQALALARQQGAKALELRAALSLSRVWRAHGKHKAAHELLAREYHWFSEGFDTVDLRTARDVLTRCPLVT